MKKYLIFLLLCSCTSYVPLEYRTPGEFPATKDSYISIVITKEADLAPSAIEGLQEQLGEKINQDGWLKYQKEKGPKPGYELIIKKFKLDSQPWSSSIQELNQKKIRTSNYRILGLADFDIQKVKSPMSKEFNVKVEDTISSTAEMPEPHGATSLAPIFNTLLGYNEEHEAIRNQDTALAIAANENVRVRLINAIRTKITPVKKTINVEIEDDKDDMDGMKNLVREKNYTAAIFYLNSLNETQKRSDVYYNTGVVYELQNRFEEACPYFQLAHDLKQKTLYLEEKARCEARLIEYKQLPL